MDTPIKKGVKVMLILIDGIADYQISELGGNNFLIIKIGLTPMEKARIPNLDKLCKGGLTGIHDPVQTNLA